MDLKPFLTLTEWEVAEPRKDKAYVLTVTQFLFNVGQIARFFFPFTFANTYFSCVF